MSSSKNLEAARAAVRRLFDTPPINMAELKERLSGHPKDDLRRALIEQLEQDRVPAHLHQLFDAAIGLVKPGNLRGRISAVALDTTRPDELRALALGTLLRCDAAEARRVAEALAPGDHERLMAVPLRGLAVALLDADSPGQGVKDLCAASPELTAIVVFEMEKLRGQRGATATEIYGPALEAGLLREQRHTLVEAIGDDGDNAAIELLERLRDAAGDDDAFQGACQAALLRARSARIAPAPKPAGHATGRAWVTTCDGQGAFTILVEFPGKHGSDPTIANLCIRASAEIRDGFSEAMPPYMVPDLVERFEEIMRVIPVPGGVAAALSHAGVARSEAMRKSIPKDARRSVKLLSHVEPDPLPPWPVEPAPMPSRERVHALFVGPAHRAMSWFFDGGDFAAGGKLPSLPANPDPTSLGAWLGDAAAVLDTPEMRARLVEIARHEARCLAWSGDEAEAAVFVALGMDAETNGLRDSPWAHAMILQGFQKAGFDDDDDDALTSVDLVGDPDLRRSFRGQFFKNVEAPTGRDLAHLDFTELCYHGLEQAAQALPGHRRIASEDLRETAHELGVAVADAIIAGADEGALARIVESAVSTGLGLTAEEDPDESAGVILGGIDEFLAIFCEECPHRCLDKPNAAMRKAFVSEQHPGL